MKNFIFQFNSIKLLWKNWHCSFNAWAIQYIYIPLGGNKSPFPALTSLAVFLFIAVWHGLAPGFLLWGLGVAVLFTLEQIIPTGDKSGDVTRHPPTLKTLARAFLHSLLFVTVGLGSALLFHLDLKALSTHLRGTGLYSTFFFLTVFLFAVGFNLLIRTLRPPHIP